jgi:spermidine synthase
VQHLQFPIRGDKIAMTVGVREHVHQRQTEFQRIDVYDTFALGKVLFLDGHVQLSEFDEYAYHEALIHIPMLSLKDPRRVLVVGAGDGGVLRELVKHNGLERIDMVEIDRGVIEVSKEFLSGVSAGAFDDPRVRLHIGDAFPFLKQVIEPYDLIVMDVTDVYEDEEGALSEQLFTRDFYVDCLNALTDQGVLVTQADNHVFCPYSLSGILSMFASVFPKVGCYQATVPSFGGFSAFAWAGKEFEARKTFPLGCDLELRYLNDATYRFAFSMLDFSLEGR